MNMKRFLILVILIVVFTFQTSSLTVLTCDGHYYMALTEDQKTHVVFGFLLAAQTMREAYGDLPHIGKFTKDGEQVGDIRRYLNIYYSKEGNLDTPLYQVIVKMEVIT